MEISGLALRNDTQMYEFGGHVRDAGLAAWLGLECTGHLFFLTKVVDSVTVGIPRAYGVDVARILREIRSAVIKDSARR